MNEIWKDIKGYKGLYQISNLGNVKSLKREKLKKDKIIKPYNTKGYLRIGLLKNKVRKGHFIHRLIAQEFIPNPENKPFINHINGITNDNNIKNLEWCTHQENVDHAWRTGLMKPPNKGKFGINSSRHTEVLQFDLSGNFVSEYGSVAEAGRKINLCPSVIFNVCSGIKKTAGGYYWKYKKDIVKIERNL